MHPHDCSFDAAGDLLASATGWMVFRPASADLAIAKARRLRGYNGRRAGDARTTSTRAEPAFVTADIMALRGGIPIRVSGEVVGAKVLLA